MCLRYLFSTSAKTLWRLFFDAVVQLNIYEQINLLTKARQKNKIVSGPRAHQFQAAHHIFFYFLVTKFFL